MMGAGCVERRKSGSERGEGCNSRGLLTKWIFNRVNRDFETTKPTK